ncbi:MAG: hypothetical protein NC452_16085 [Eubacterium sp.]|nr:hypothetical protein [Eubacterium sp.]
MSPLNVRRGKYGLYNGKLYRILSKSFSSKSDTIEICSTDEQDLKNGFTNNDSEFFTKKYGFTCTKEVPKYEITEAYEIRTYVVFREMKFGIISLDDEFIRIQNECSNDPNDETNKQLRSWGFSEYIRDKFSIIFDKYIPTNDPEIKIIEERKEIDISKL